MRFKAAGEPSVKLVRPVRESMLAIIPRLTYRVDRRSVRFSGIARSNNPARTML